MRYGIELELFNEKQVSRTILIELYDYSYNYIGIANALLCRLDAAWDIKKLIDNGITIILKEEGLSKDWHLTKFEIFSMEEDAILDYQLYVDIERNETCVNKISYDLKRVE